MAVLKINGKLAVVSRKNQRPQLPSDTKIVNSLVTPADAVVDFESWKSNAQKIIQAGGDPGARQGHNFDPLWLFPRHTASHLFYARLEHGKGGSRHGGQCELPARPVAAMARHPDQGEPICFGFQRPTGDGAAAFSPDAPLIPLRR